MAAPLLAVLLVGGLAACTDDEGGNGDTTPTPAGSASAGSSGAPGADGGGTAAPTRGTDPTRAPATGEPKTPLPPPDKGPVAPPAGAAELKAALLNAQEIEAGYTVSETSVLDDDRSEPDPVASDPRCAPLVDSERDRVAGVSREYSGSTDLEGRPQPDVTVNLTSHPAAGITKRYADIEKALKQCPSFTVRDGSDTYGYEVRDVRTGGHGPRSLAYTAVLTLGAERVEFAVTAAIVGDTTAVHITATPGADGVARMPARFADGQIDKARSELGG